MTNMNYIRTVN